MRTYSRFCFSVSVSGATYRLRISNVGLKTTLNFKIQDHEMLLVETEGAYTIKAYHQNLDIHVGQSYSVLVTAKDHSHSSSYHMVASSRFIPRKISGLAIIRYPGFDAEVPMVPVLPDEHSQDEYGYSTKQALSIRYKHVTRAVSYKNRTINCCVVSMFIN